MLNGAVCTPACERFCACALMRKRTRCSRDKKETRESPLKLDRAEDNSTKTVFRSLSHTPVVTACMRVKHNCYHLLTLPVDVRSRMKQ